MEDRVPKSVNLFISLCAKEIGAFEEDNWNIDLWNNCQDHGIKSPIEQILFCALQTIRRLNRIEADGVWEYNGQQYLTGLSFYPQYKIDKYRVDFLISQHTYNSRTHSASSKEVIVECDSQEFHERDEKERRYEKSRDRYFQTNGYKVFHYTGAEILANPLDIAIEIISYVTDIKKDILISEGRL